jgi:hypothetical protein
MLFCCRMIWIQTRPPASEYRRVSTGNTRSRKTKIEKSSGWQLSQYQLTGVVEGVGPKKTTGEKKLWASSNMFSLGVGGFFKVEVELIGYDRDCAS